LKGNSVLVGVAAIFFFLLGDDCDKEGATVDDILAAVDLEVLAAAATRGVSLGVSE